MPRELALTARQVTAICKGAAKAGFVAEVKIGDVFVRLMPGEMANAQGVGFDPDKPETFDTFEQYLAWRDRRASNMAPTGISKMMEARLEAFGAKLQAKADFRRKRKQAD